MGYKNEKEVADQAIAMLGNALRSKVSGFASHMSKNASMKDVEVTAKMWQSGNKNGQGKQYMKSLSIKMARHGFILHHGADNIRKGGERTRTEPKTTKYSFKSHYYRLKAKPFIDDAIRQSGVIDFVMKNIAEQRSEELVFNIKKMIENGSE